VLSDGHDYGAQGFKKNGAMLPGSTGRHRNPRSYRAAWLWNGALPATFRFKLLLHRPVFTPT